jgi:hypothetical protein
MFKICFITLLLLTTPTWAKGAYLEPQDFLRLAFHGSPPEPAVYWLNNDDKAHVDTILQRPSRLLRQRYWKQDARSAWILEEIGKEKPITVGVIIQQGQIETIRVLVFRESRGWEVKHDFFTDQFIAARLTHKHDLDRHIDGISGATLSVRAMIKIARLALYLDQQVRL